MTAPALTVYTSGTSQVSGDNLNTFGQTCGTVANLRSFIGTTGIQVYMRGFSSSGDGGQGWFYWNASGIALDDGGVTTIVPNGAAAGEWTRLSTDSGIGSGTVTSVSVTTANGVSGTVATATTTPAITLTLGAITPSSIIATGTVTGSNLSGTNTGDQTITLTGDVTGTGAGTFAATIAANAVSNAKFRQSVARSVVGVTGNATANVADIQGAANQILAINTAGTSLQFQSTMDNVTIGATTPAASTFTTMTATSDTIGVVSSSSGSLGDIVSETIGPYTLSSGAIATSYIGSKISMPVMSGTALCVSPTGLRIVSPTLTGSAFAVTAIGISVSALTINSSTVSLTNSYCENLTMASVSGGVSVINVYGTKIDGITVSGASSAVTNAISAFVGSPTVASSGAITSCYGMYASNMGGSGITTSYGFYTDAQSGSTTNYAYYYASSTPWYVDKIGYTKDAGKARVGTQFDKTSDTALADITNLSVTLLAAGVYSIRAHLSTTAGASGGMKVAIAGSSTATSISYTGYNYNGTTINAVSTATALGTAVGAATAVTTNIIIEGVIVVNAAGTLTCQMAQNASNGTTSSILVNSKFIVERIS